MPTWKLRQFGNIAPYSFVQALYMICQDPRIAGAYTVQIKKRSALLARLSQRLSAFTSRCGTDTAGREASEPPPEDGARTKLFDREFQFREWIVYWDRDENKLLTYSLKEEWSYIYTRAPHRRQHSPAPVLRVGQGGTRTRKRGKSCSCSIRHRYWKFEVMPRVEYKFYEVLKIIIWHSMAAIL